jgi:hypothetical protein
MTAGQFAALAQLLRLRQGKAQAVARRVLVDGEVTPAAARSEGLEYRTAFSAVKRARIGFALAQRAVNPEQSKNDQ